MHGSGVNFREQQRRLIAHLHELVRSGDATERGLARLTGVSQPHMHNVLKGKRLFSLDMADQVLAQLHLDLLDFVEPLELMERERRR
jgi:plasmid maintenance system antidote protein VapI